MDGNKKGLTIKQEKFCRSVVESGNATQAAVESYNTSSRKSANALAGKLLGEAKINSRINDLLDSMCPQIDSKIVAWLSKAVDAPVEEKGVPPSGDLPAISWAEKRNYFQLLLELRGYMIKKTLTVRANAKIARLPSE